MKKSILGIKIDDVASGKVVEIVEKWVGGKTKHYIVTPNPEIVVMAQKDNELKKIINNADLAIPDGIGLKLATDIENTSPGVDVMEELVKMASDKGFTVGLLGGKKGVAEETSERLQQKYPGLKVSFAESGVEVDEEGNMTPDYPLREASRLPASRGEPTTDLLFVAFGPPKQEKWIAKNLAKLNVKVAMGVGGAFDFLSGRILRAPKWMSKLGLEWLFRLAVQPWRFKRQFVLLKYIWLLTRGK